MKKLFGFGIGRLLIALSLLVINPFSALPILADCTPAPAGLVAWWPGEDNANDIAGTNNGTLLDGITFTNGEVGQAFSSLNTNGPGVKVPASPSLNVGVGNGFTLEAWINPKDVSQRFPIFEWNQGDGVTYWGVHLHLDPFAFGAGPGTLYANIVDNVGGWHQIYAAGVITNGAFQHVALTYDITTGMATLYCNGAVVAQESLGIFTPQTTYDLYLGQRPLSPPGEQYSFVGAIDEPAIYSRALSSNEIAAIYIAGSSGKCIPTCTPAPSGIVAWWSGEGNANDIAGTNNGIAQNITYTNGEVGQAFVFDGSSSQIGVPASPSLDVGLGSGLTVEVWVNPANLNLQELCEWNQNNGDPSGATQIGVHMEINEAPGDGSFYGNVVDTTATSHVFHSVTGLITANNFQHLAMTYDKTSGVGMLYRNGVMVAAANLGTFTPQTSFDFFMGNRPSGFFTGIYFQGEMDEPTIYNRALSSNEIAAIYDAGSAGKCAAPFIVEQPTTQTVVEGSDVALSVAVEGAGPFSYQWTLNGKNISGATNVTLSLTNLHLKQSGSYLVNISTPSGIISSSAAIVTVIAQNILVYNYSGIEEIIMTGSEFSYSYSGRMFFIPDSTNGTFIGWATIGGKKQYWVSPFSDYLLATIPGSQHRVYTILGKAGSEIDTNGQPHIWAYLHKGQNETLTIGSKKYFPFPNIFSCNDTHVYPDPSSGQMIFRNAVSAYVFASTSTQTANNTGQTLTDLVNVQINLLVKQGYKKQ